MPAYVALLRAVNVGGKRMLPMKELSAICVDIGFENVRTYIQSGNVVFESSLRADAVRASLERAIEERTGMKVETAVRTAAEMRSVLEANPFPDADASKVSVLFLSKPVPERRLDSIAGPDGEQVRAGHREIYVHYPNGMGRSKLKLPVVDEAATARNINTVRKLVDMTAGVPAGGS